MTTNIKFGFCEILGLFAAAALWHNTTLAIVSICIAAIGAFFRVALDIQAAKNAEQTRQNAAKVLNEQAGEFGKVLKDVSQMLGKNQYGKNKKSSGGGFH